MTDREFELLLEDRLTDLPPDDNLVAEITPWRRAANRILLGTALCSITLNFLLLNFLLPAMGLGLILLGFRSLRRENRWFMAGYAVAVLRMILCIFNLIRSATIWNSASPWMTVTGVTLTILHALCVWGGFRAVQIKAGVEQSSRGFWLVVFFVLITVLGAAGFQGTFVILILLVLYILLLRSLWKYAAFLDDAGYAVQASPVRISDRAVAIGLAVITAVGILCGYLFFDQYPMDWTEQEGISAEAATIKEELLGLGFPAEVLEDLTDEEILACQGARTVYVETEEMAVNKGIQVSRMEDNVIHVHTEYPIKELLLTHVAVEPAEGETWMVFHHFLWTKTPFYRGTEAIKIWPAYGDMKGWDKGSHLSGRILYDGDGTIFTAPFRSLGEQSYTSNSFFGPQQNTDIIAAFALPSRGKNCRGYVCYDMEMREAGWAINSWCNYFYQQRPNYPIQTADDFAMSGFILGESAFRKCQSALQQWPEDLEGSDTSE